MKKLNLGNINAGLNSLKAATDNAAQNGRFELIDANIDVCLCHYEQQITPESVWQTEIFERKVKENEEKSDGNRGEAQRKRGKKKGARDVLHGLRGHNAKGFAGSGGTDFNAKI